MLFGTETAPEKDAAVGADETGEKVPEPDHAVASRREFLFFPGSDNTGAQFIVAS